MPKIAQIQNKVTPIISDTKLYAPLVFSYKNVLVESTRRLNMQLDAVVTLKLNQSQTKLMAFLLPITAPKSVQNSLNMMRTYREQIDGSNLLKDKLKKIVGSNERNYLLILPFLTDTALEIAKQNNVSVVDLCGNYNIMTDGIVAFRRDQPNQYKDSNSIKKIFSGNSSLVPRFLLKENKIYSSVNEIYNGILNLGGSLTLSTVSKVLSALQDELMIAKEGKSIKVIQADKILTALEKAWQPPKIENEIKLKVEGGQLEIMRFLKDRLGDSWIASGETSAFLYTTTTEPAIYKIFTQQMGNLASKVDDRFFNTVIQQTEKIFVYFDLQKKEGNWSSELQAYLELSQGDKREKEIAESIKQNILRRFK